MAKSLRKRQKRLNDRRNAHSKTLEDLRRISAKFNPASFRQPGSMKQKG